MQQLEIENTGSYTFRIMYDLIMPLVYLYLRIRRFTVYMVPDGKMAKAAAKGRRRKRNVPISLSSTDTYTAAEYLTTVLHTRTLAYIIALPPSFLFIVCLLLISAFLPFLGWYVESAGSIPDLNTMMVCF